MSLIIFHEIGHLTSAKIFNWQVDKIYIYPLGGITRFNDKINKPLVEDLIVTLMGPIFQIILAYFLIKLDSRVYLFNKTLLLFNLLPIAPLDGSKLVAVFLSLIIRYKKSLYLNIVISFITYLFVLSYFVLYKNSIIFLFVIFLLFFKIIDEKNKISFYFDKFLLERYLYIFKFKKTKVVKDVNNFYKYKNNIVKTSKLKTEKELLKEYFEK